MAFIMLVLLLALGLAAVLGAVVDTRDAADWRIPDPRDRDRLRH